MDEETPQKDWSPEKDTERNKQFLEIEQRKTLSIKFHNMFYQKKSLPWWKDSIQIEWKKKKTKKNKKTNKQANRIWIVLLATSSSYKAFEHVRTRPT